MLSRLQLSLLAALCAGGAARAEIGPQILYPLYSYPNWYAPSNYLWGQVAAAASMIKITAIINPDSGPGGPPNADYLHGMSDLQKAGVTMIGYVATGYGKTALATVEQQIDTYEQQFSAAGMTGIFLDEASADPAQLSYYTTLYNYIKAEAHVKEVVTNPGTNIPEAFISAPTADLTVVYEDTAGWRTYVPDSYLPNYPGQRFAALLLNVATVPAMQADLTLARQRNVGFVFATNRTVPNPYDTLPAYWLEEIDALAEPGYPVLTAAKGAAIPGQTAGPVYGAFGLPQTGAFAGTALMGRTSQAAIFAGDGSVLLEAGQPMPHLANTVISKLGQPSGDAALVTLRPGAGGITSQTAAILATGLSASAPVVAAQTGAAGSGLPPGTTIKRFLAIDGNGANTFFLALLEGTLVTGKNDLALCATNGASLNLLVQKGAMVNGKLVSVLTTLAGSPQTLADGRWRAGATAVGVRLTFTDKSEAIYMIPATAASQADWNLLAQTGASTVPALEGAVIAGFGLPGFGAQGFAVQARLTIGSGEGGVCGGGSKVTAADDTALLTGAYTGTPVVLARKGDAVTADSAGIPLTGVKVNALGDPIVGAAGNVAFLLTASGVTAQEEAKEPLAHTSIAVSTDGATWRLLANQGSIAPGGGNWAGFPSLAITNGTPGGPIFTGALKVSGNDGVTAADALGLWAVESGGSLGLLLRSGQTLEVNGKLHQLRTFTALAPAPGSIGTASGYAQNGNVEVLAGFTDGTESLLDLAVP